MINRCMEKFRWHKQLQNYFSTKLFQWWKFWTACYASWTWVPAVCNQASLTIKELDIAHCIRCHHVYRNMGDSCLQTTAWDVKGKFVISAHDRYAVAVKLTRVINIVGHLLWKVSRVCLLFLHRGGTVEGTVTRAKSGARRQWLI